MTTLDPDPRFVGPDCAIDGCQREIGHIGDHHRPSPDYIAGREWRVVAAAVAAGIAVVVALAGLGLWRWRG